MSNLTLLVNNILCMGQVAQGEYVDPETLEEIYSKSNYIAQV
jgi:hypothetical protein